MIHQCSDVSGFYVMPYGARAERFRVPSGLVRSGAAYHCLLAARSAVVRGGNCSLGDARAQSYQTVRCQRSRRTTRDARRQVIIIIIIIVIIMYIYIYNAYMYKNVQKLKKPKNFLKSKKDVTKN